MDMGNCVKEMDNISSLVKEAKATVYQMCDQIRSVVQNKIFSLPTQATDSVSKEPPSSNKFDSIIADLHMIINTVSAFSKQEISVLSSELDKL